VLLMRAQGRAGWGARNMKWVACVAMLGACAGATPMEEWGVDIAGGSQINCRCVTAYLYDGNGRQALCWTGGRVAIDVDHGAMGVLYVATECCAFSGEMRDRIGRRVLVEPWWKLRLACVNGRGEVLSGCRMVMEHYLDLMDGRSEEDVWYRNRWIEMMAESMQCCVSNERGEIAVLLPPMKSGVSVFVSLLGPDGIGRSDALRLEKAMSEQAQVVTIRE
jgi:hypothetical protein